VLAAIVEAVPVRLVKRDLLFVVERLAAVLDERRLAIVPGQHCIGKAKGPADTPAKLLAAFMRKSEDGIFGRCRRRSSSFTWQTLRTPPASYSRKPPSSRRWT
jgi:ParB family chromosome partitioning protein